jgi:hypothetical protein
MARNVSSLRIERNRVPPAGAAKLSRAEGMRNLPSLAGLSGRSSRMPAPAGRVPSAKQTIYRFSKSPASAYLILTASIPHERKQFMNHRIVVLLATVCLAGSVHAQNQPAAPADIQAALQQLGSLMGGGSTGGTAVVNVRELKALLPAALPGMTRKNASGEKSGAFGMVVSQAEGEYEGADGATIRIKLSDVGGMGGFMAFAHAGWAMSEVDKETDTGYERTLTYKGNKAFERYDGKTQEAEFQSFVNNRYSVEISGSKVTAEQINAARDQIDFDALAKLKPDAAP